MEARKAKMNKRGRVRGGKQEETQRKRQQPRNPQGTVTSTGASTPVSTKIKRFERQGEVDSNKIQPTLRYFVDLKCGLLGAGR